MADDDIQLDENGDYVPGADGDVGLVEDEDTLEQDIRHRLMTVKGSLPADPEYGAGLPLFLHAEATPQNLVALHNACVLELAKEERILPQRTRVTILRSDPASSRVIVQYVRKDTLEPGQTEVTA